MSRPFHHGKRRAGKRRAGYPQIRRCSRFGRFAGQDATALLASAYANESTDFHVNEHGGNSAWLVEGPFDKGSLRSFSSHELGCIDGYVLLNRTERTFIARQAGAVVLIASDGFVTVDWHRDKGGLYNHWKEVEGRFGLGEDDEEEDFGEDEDEGEDDDEEDGEDECLNCGGEIPPDKYGSEFCSDACEEEWDGDAEGEGSWEEEEEEEEEDKEEDEGEGDPD